jgi:uncharacterized protein YecE (DUF72 family)
MGGRRGKARKAANLYIGTSGWAYGTWGEIFYPKKVRSTYDRLTFYSQSFNAVEVNYSFYHLPKPETCTRWAAVVPRGFLFAVKASRYITHVRRLEGVEEAWGKLAASIRSIGDRLGPILLQLPESFHLAPDRLRKFLALVQRDRATPHVLPVFEFRHPSWFTEATYDILRKAGAALCIAHSSRYPCVEEVTADLVYYRFHGPKEFFASRYTKQQLQSWATKMHRHMDAGRTVHAYFNNDWHGYAVQNARTLRELLEGKRGR